MPKKYSSLEKKREKLIKRGIIKENLLENINSQLHLSRGFALNLCGHCTARCNYCPQSFEKYPEEYIETDIVNKLLHEVRAYPCYFQFGTRGENLLHPSFFEIMFSIKKSNPLHYVTLNTNGLLMKEEDFILKVLRSGVDQLIFSLQSINPKIYTTLTNNPNLDEVLVNILTTIRLRDQESIDVLIGIQFLNTKENGPFYEDFERFWEPYNVYTYSQVLHSWGDKFDSSEETNKERYPCLYLWLYPNISHKGNICSCFADFYDENIYGNLRYQSLQEIWTSSNIRKTMMEQHLNSDWDKNKLCKNCNGWTEFENVFVKNSDKFMLPGACELKS